MAGVQSARMNPSRVTQRVSMTRPLGPRVWRMQPPWASACNTRCSILEMFMEDARFANSPGAQVIGRFDTGSGLCGDLPGQGAVSGGEQALTSTIPGQHA